MTNLRDLADVLEAVHQSLLGAHNAANHVDVARHQRTLGDIAERNINTIIRSLRSVDDISPTTLDEAKKRTILNALRRNKGNRKKTAEELDIDIKTCYRLLAKYPQEELALS